MSLLSSQWLPASLSMEAKVTKMALVGPLCSNTQGCDLLPHLLPLLIPSQSLGLSTLHWLSSLPQTMAWLIPSRLLSLLSNHLLSGVSSDCSISYGNLSSYLSFPIRTLVQRPEAETFVSFVYECFPSA